MLQRTQAIISKFMLPKRISRLPGTVEKDPIVRSLSEYFQNTYSFHVMTNGIRCSCAWCLSTMYFVCSLITSNLIVQLLIAAYSLPTSERLLWTHTGASITSIHPAVGPPSGGIELTIFGSGFSALSSPSSSLKVFIGRNACSHVVVVNDSTIVCDVPEGYGCDFDVRVLPLFNIKLPWLADGVPFVELTIKSFQYRGFSYTGDDPLKLAMFLSSCSKVSLMCDGRVGSWPACESLTFLGLKLSSVLGSQ
jgi:hypothetical protein